MPTQLIPCTCGWTRGTPRTPAASFRPTNQLQHSGDVYQRTEEPVDEQENIYRRPHRPPEDSQQDAIVLTGLLFVGELFYLASDVFAEQGGEDLLQRDHRLVRNHSTCRTPCLPLCAQNSLLLAALRLQGVWRSFARRLCRVIAYGGRS